MVWQFEGVLTLLAALGCGLVAGVFFTFSTFVMQALFRLPAHEGIAAMQSINIVVLNPWFLGTFFGTGAICVLLIVLALVSEAGFSAAFGVLGSALYLVGTLGVTIVCNVPRNQALAKLDPKAPDSVAHWDDYVRNWTRWNHVRTIAALLAAAVFSVMLAV
ncbi:anthrone oxygenase family protein [Modicisalibacter muralis]|nr:anthrone oxygenase family protein [Halomonas muralis]